MSGVHRAGTETKLRVVFAGALTAGAMLLAPVGLANAAGPPSGPGSDPGSGDQGGGTTTTTKNTIRLPGLKIEIKNTRGDHKPPTIKIVPLPGLHLLG